jgi:hypothetical protein
MVKKTQKNKNIKKIKGGGLESLNNLTEQEKQNRCKLCDNSFDPNVVIRANGMILDNRIFRLSNNCNHVFHIGCLNQLCIQRGEGRIGCPECNEQIIDCRNIANKVAIQFPVGTRDANYDKRDLTLLPPLPAGLEILKCSDNKLTQLPNLPNSLETISCTDNELIVLPDILPERLTSLDCTDNVLEILPLLPENLKKLYCSVNYLTTLTKSEFLPDSVTELHCYNNELTYLPKINKDTSRLYIFFCENNFLESLPDLPDRIYMINCSNNQLKTIPALPKTKLTLNCAHNPLISLPNLYNVNDLTISVYQVPLLESNNLPEFKFIKIKVIDEKEEEYSKEFTKELEDKYKAINIKFKELVDRLELKCPLFLNKVGNIASVKITSQTPLPKLPKRVTENVFKYLGGKKTKRKTHKKKRMTRKKSYKCKSKSKSGYK